MSKPISFGELDIQIVASMNEARSKPETETPFRICILGDFSGRANRSMIEQGSVLSDLRAIEIDRDNIDEVMSKLDIEIHLSFGKDESTPFSVRFSELDDFHPDHLLERLEVFRALRETRKKLKDTRTFESAASDVRSWMESIPEQSDPGTKTEHPPSGPATAEQTSGSLLDQIISETEDLPPETRTVSDPSDWNAFLRNIVRPHLVPADDPQQQELMAAVDAAASGLMAAILHHPDFQDIEAAWRALSFLVLTVETDAQLKVYLLDISKAELAANLGASEDLRSSEIYNLLVTQTIGTPGGEPWAVLAGNYTFNQTLEDVETLGRMAKIASHAGAPFISAVHAHVLGCETLAEMPAPEQWQRSSENEGSQAWELLRSIPEASYLGLAIPRFLLRLPYGEDTDPVDGFVFEEMNGAPVHEKYLWGNPSFACALLLAQAFRQYGWDLRPGAVQDIEGLPLHIYTKFDESVIKPCTEALLNEHAVEEILKLGIMPLASFKNQDMVRFVRIQSLADPLKHLAGRWVSKKL